MKYVFILIAFIFVTMIALFMKSKRKKQLEEMRDKEQEFLMNEQIKAAAEKKSREQS